MIGRRGAAIARTHPSAETPASLQPISSRWRVAIRLPTDSSSNWTISPRAARSLSSRGCSITAALTTSPQPVRFSPMDWKRCSPHQFCRASNKPSK